MADNQIEIEVIAKTDLSEVEGLESLVDEVKSKAEEAVQLNIEIDEVTSELEEVNEEIDELQTELANIELGTSDADFSEVTSQLEEAEAKAEELSAELESLNDQTVTLTVDSSSIDEAKNSLEETASTADNLTTALAGIGAAAGIEQMVTTADNINTSWNRLDLTFSEAGGSMDDLKSKASALSDATGRSGGVIRDYFNQMGIAGVTNTDLLSSSFEALAGKSYQTGNSIESMKGRLQRMVMTGQASGMSLQRLGIDAEDLGRAMGVTAEEASKAFKELTPEERLEAITKAMGDGAEANEMYKNSYAGLKERADAAMAGLMGAVGQAILPVVIPALQAATDVIKALSAGFQALPGPVQSVIGAVGGMIAIGTAAVGTIGLMGNVVNGVIKGFKGLKDAANLVGIADKLSPLKTALLDVASAAKKAAVGLLDAGRKALIAGANAVRSAAMWVAERAAKIASMVASKLLAAAQMILNAVMSMNPIMLVVIALIALAAALIWAYNNVDWFRAMVDNAWQAIQGFAGWLAGSFMGAINGIGSAFQNAGQTIQSSIQGAVDFVMGALQGLWSYIMTLGGLIPENTQITGNAVIDSILKVMAFMATLPEQIAMYLINIIAESLGFGENFCQNMITGAANAVSGFLEWIGQLPVQVEENLAAVVTSTVTWLTSLWESITTITLQIADALAFPFVNIGLIVYESLMTVWSVITGILGSIWASVSAFGQNFSMTMMTAAMNAVNGFVSWISQLPGRAWTQLSQVISRATSFASSFASQMMHAGTNAVTQFTNSIRNLSNGFRAELQEIISAATNFVGEIGSILYNAGANAIQNFLSGLGRHSPGIMQREFVAEINEMGERVPNESRLLLSNVGKLGENIVDEFGEPTLGVRFDDTANARFTNLVDGSTPRSNVINLNLEIGSVDNEDRIQEIVEAVRRELAWNNLLAGRNVDDIS